MIIVSQDKEIINLDNVTRIFIEDFSEDGDGFGIGADTNSAESQCWDLGYYKTKERAKEVLQEIIKCYKATEGYKIADEEGRFYLEQNNTIFEYEMPKE